MRRPLVTLALLAAAAATSISTPSAAQSSAAMAEALFQQGRDLLQAEKLAEACPKFAESQRLEPKLGTLLNLAVCEQRLGRIASAWAAFTSAATIAVREGQDDRATFARAQIEVIETKLSFVTIRAAQPLAEGFTILLDDEPFERAMLDTRLPLDPGEHHVVARATGKVPWSSVVAVPPERNEISMMIPVLSDVPTSPAAAAPPPSEAPPKVTWSGPVEEVPPEDYQPLIYAGLGVGAAGLLVGTITGIITLSKASDIKSACGDDTTCPQSQQDPISSATTVANVSNVGFVVGALGLGVAAVGYYLAGKQPEPAQAGLSVTPLIGPGSAGISGHF